MKRILMLTGAKMLLSPLLAIVLLTGGHAAVAANGVTVYTPYTKISVPPGESIDYNIDVINDSGGVRNVEIAVTGIPKDWEYELKSGGFKIGQLSVLSGEKKSISLRVNVPLQINKGTYRFNVVAKGYYSLPLTVIVSEQGTFKTEFTAKQPNMEGNSKSTFTFNTELKNRTAESQMYGLRADVPRGWNATFKYGGRQVTSVQVEANKTESIIVEVDPPDAIEAGTYKIPVAAGTSTTSANVELEVVVTGSYGMELTTPLGLVSTDITAGDDKRVEMVVKNTGSTELKNIKLEYSAPVNWSVTFEPKTIDVLEAGKTAQVYATITADDKAIAGDYVTNLEAKTPEVSSKVSFRVSVKTAMLWGWVGVLIISAVLGNVYYLFRKYGRR